MRSKKVKKLESLDKSRKIHYNYIVLRITFLKGGSALAKGSDRLYVFSVANVDFGKVVASVDRSGRKVDGEDLFRLLGISSSETEAIREHISGYGKRPYATLCGTVNKKAVFFFKHFSFDTSLCLAIIPAISAKRVADIFACGVFDDYVLSDSLSGMALTTDCGRALIEDSEGYLHLVRTFGQIMELLELKLQYVSENIPTLRPAAEGITELLDLDLNYNTCFVQDEDLIAVDEIFDGRFCAAALLITFFVAEKRSSDRSIIVTEVRGLGGIEMRVSFPCRRNVGFEAIGHIKKLAEVDHGIRFELDCRQENIQVSFVPLYQDVGFVGVKNGDEIFDIVKYREMF